MKTTIKLLAVLISLMGCVRYAENSAPHLQGVVEDISINMNDSITLLNAYVSGYDLDGDNLTLHVLDGENYTLSGLTIIPTRDFVGDLFIPIRLFDGELYSAIDTMIVSVVNTITIFPLYETCWWEYRDSIHSEDSARTSRLEVGGPPIYIIVDGTTRSVSLLEWSNLKEHNILYMVNNEDDGFYQYGVIAGSDTIIKPQLQHSYPSVVGDTWPFVQIQYNVTDDDLFEGKTVTMTCTDTQVYVTVPAGTFRCAEYRFTYDMNSNRANQLRASIMPQLYASRASETVTEIFYFCDGVGYIKNVSLIGSDVVFTKELTNYYVEEKYK